MRRKLFFSGLGEESIFLRGKGERKKGSKRGASRAGRRKGVWNRNAIRAGGARGGHPEPLGQGGALFIVSRVESWKKKRAPSVGAKMESRFLLFWRGLDQSRKLCVWGASKALK